ncbi:MAG: M56 family metallopeptidase [Solobacterium sp.]|nr:M56 family metallopeptidase [Solobacterium sp.]
MTIRQLVWAGITALVFGIGFHRAWQREHGSEGSNLFAYERAKETHVVVVPTVLFWVLLTLGVIFILMLGLQEGLIRFAALLADVMIVMSGYFAVLLIILPYLRRTFSARVCAVLWLVPAFLSYYSYLLLQSIPLPKLTLYIPRSSLPMIAGVWLAGFLVTGGYYLFSHIMFRRRVLSTASEETDAETLAIWQRERDALNYSLPVRLLRADVSAPFSMGQINQTRCTVLPRYEYTTKELSMIFSHELHHLQRCDVDTKVFLCLCRALCWFNPLVWFAAKKAAGDLELSCDEIVTENMTDEQRKAYAHLLLEASAPAGGCTTSLSDSAETLRYRLKGILHFRKRQAGTWLLMAAVFVSAMSFGIISVSDMRGSFASLILGSDAKIVKIVEPQFRGVDQFDSTALLAELDTIELEHIAGLRDGIFEGEYITFVLSDGRFASMSDKAIFVDDYDRGRRNSDAYIIRSGMDWEALRSTFR